MCRLLAVVIDRFLLEDFDARSTFASFLPGVAGYFGKPVWAFYVNRGQGKLQSLFQWAVSTAISGVEFPLH